MIFLVLWNWALVTRGWVGHLENVTNWMPSVRFRKYMLVLRLETTGEAPNTCNAILWNQNTSGLLASLS